MKTRVAFTLMLLSLLLACKKKDEVNPANACQLTKATAADGSYATVEYDNSGNVTKSTAYDKAGNVTTTTLVDYTNGKLSQLRNFNGATTTGTPSLTMTATTDAQNNIQSVSFPFLGVTVKATLSYDKGRVSKITYSGGSGGSVVRHEFDARGNVSKIYQQFDGEPEKLYYEATYDEKNNPLKNNSITLLVGLYGSNVAQSVSTNNPLVEKKYTNGSLSSTVTNTYTYNDQGFPLTRSDGKTSETLGYTCK